jgi:hypothetical protein
MIRTQIYLTEEEHSGVGMLAKQRKKPQSEIIRQAIDEYLVRSNPADKLSKLRKGKGIWKGRKIELEALREEFDRFK